MDGTRIPPDYETLVQRVYETLLVEGDVAFDVGAHVGRHAREMARLVGPAGRVLAFEPLPECLAELRRLSDVEAHACALGATAGPAEFVVAVDLPSYSGLRERLYDRPTRLERLPVAVRTLDDLADDLFSLRLVKIDVEGGELDVFRGGLRTLARLRPVVVFEFGLRAIGNYDASPGETFALLAEVGYRLYGIDGRRLDAESFAQAATVQVIYDYVAVPDEDAEAVAAVEAVLRGPTLKLLQAQAALVAARLHASRIGEAPAMSRFPAWLRPMARRLGALVFQAAGPFLAPLRRSQEANAAATAALLDAVGQMEKASVASRGGVWSRPSLREGA